MRSDATSRRISPAYRKPHTGWQHRAALTGGMTYSEPARRNAARPIAGILRRRPLVVGRGDRRRPRRPVARPSLVHRRRPPRSLPSLGTAAVTPIARRVATSQRPWCARRGRRRRPRRRDGLRRRDPGVANLDPGSARCAAPRRRRMPRTTASSSTSTAAGVPRRTRSSCSARRSRSTAQKQKAARWVATPSTSAHVSGDAVDIGPSDATAWLSEHGAAYGLCQIYRNEPWHYELRPDAVDRRLPAACTPTPRTIRGCSHNRSVTPPDDGKSQSPAPARRCRPP